MLTKKVRRAIKNANLNETIKKLEKFDINDSDDYGNTALHMAYEYRDIEVIDNLKKCGADTHLENVFGEIPFFRLVHRKDASFVNELIKAGEDFNQTNSAGETILFYAIYYGKDDILKKLLEIGLNPNAKECHDWTPLHFAICLRKNSKIKILLDAGAIYNLKDNQGRIPLHYCAIYSDKEATEKLLAKDTVQVNMCDINGNTPFSYALRSGTLEVVKMMSPYAIIGKYYLHLVVQKLINQIRFFEDNSNSEILINQAIKHASEEIKIILDKGADVKVRDSDNQSALDELFVYMIPFKKYDLAEVERLLS